MKLTTDKLPTTFEGEFTKGRSGISAEDAPIVIDFMVTRLYSDPILAVVREYCTNAQDSHIMAGKPELPITICSPSELEPTLSICDEGIGLSHEDVMNDFGMLGKSGKREESRANGCFGLGCKVAYAYERSNFTIVSYFEGKKRTYLSEELVPIFVGEEECAPDKTGIEIHVPIQNKDINTFYRAIAEIASHLAIKPKILGTIGHYKINRYDVSDRMIMGGVYRTESFHLPARTSSYYAGRQSFAVLGGVSYKINQSQAMEGIDYPARLKKNILRLLVSGVIIDFDIEKYPMSMVPSREELLYTDETKGYIQLRLIEIATSLEKLEARRFEGAKTLLDAYKNYSDFIFCEKKMWKKTDVSTIHNSYTLSGNTIYFSNGVEIKNRRASNRNSTNSKNVHLDDLVAKKDVFLERVNGQMITRARTLIGEGYSRVIIVDNDSFPEVRQNFPQFFKAASDVEETKVERVYGGGGDRKAAKKSSQYQLLESYLYNDMPVGDLWKTTDETQLPKERVYVETHRNVPVKYHEFVETVEYLKSTKLMGDQFVLIGANKAQVKRLDDSWIELSDFVAKNKDKLKDDFKREIRSRVGLGRTNQLILEVEGIQRDGYGYNGNETDSISSSGSYHPVFGSMLKEFNLAEKVQEEREKIATITKKALDKYPILPYISARQVLSLSDKSKTLELIKKAK